MKRIMMTTVLLLTVVMGLQAQSIVGTWETVIETDDNDKVTVDVTFEQGNDVLIKGQLKIGEGEEGTMVMSVTFPGTYQQNGQTLTLNFDANKGKINIDEAIFPKEVEDLLADDPDKRKDVLKMMQDQVDESLAKELGDSLPLDGDLTIVKLTDTELVLNDGDDNVTFTKVK